MSHCPVLPCPYGVRVAVLAGQLPLADIIDINTLDGDRCRLYFTNAASRVYHLQVTADGTGRVLPVGDGKGDRRAEPGLQQVRTAHRLVAGLNWLAT